MTTYSMSPNITTLNAKANLKYQSLPLMTHADLRTIAQKNPSLILGANLIWKERNFAWIEWEVLDERWRWTTALLTDIPPQWATASATRRDLRSFKRLTTTTPNLGNMPRYELQNVDDGLSTAAFVLLTSKTECKCVHDAKRTYPTLSVRVYRVLDVLNDIESLYNVESTNYSIGVSDWFIHLRFFLMYYCLEIYDYSTEDGRIRLYKA